MKTVAVIDYGASNLRSVVKALEHVAGGRYRILVSDQPGPVLGADKIVFPGQGAIGQCMDALAAKGLDEVLRKGLETKPERLKGLLIAPKGTTWDGQVDALIVDVPRDEDHVDLLIAGNRHDRTQGGLELIEARTTSDRAAHVPIGGMQEAHRASP